MSCHNARAALDFPAELPCVVWTSAAKNMSARVCTGIVQWAQQTSCDILQPCIENIRAALGGVAPAVVAYGCVSAARALLSSVPLPLPCFAICITCLAGYLSVCALQPCFSSSPSYSPHLPTLVPCCAGLSEARCRRALLQLWRQQSLQPALLLPRVYLLLLLSRLLQRSSQALLAASCVELQLWFGRTILSLLCWLPPMHTTRRARGPPTRCSRISA